MKDELIRGDSAVIEFSLTDGTRGTLLGKIELKKDVTTHKAGDTDEN